MLTGIQGPSFRGGYYKIKCTDTAQAKKLMSEMQAKLRAADYIQGSKSDEIIIKATQNAHDAKAVMECMNEASRPKSTVNNVLDTYRKFQKDQPVPKVNVRL